MGSTGGIIVEFHM